jgi:hypothetical protein
MKIELVPDDQPLFLTTLTELVDINSLTDWVVAPVVAWKLNLDSIDTDSAHGSDGRPWRAKKNLLLENALLVKVRSRVLYTKFPKCRLFCLEGEDLIRAAAVDR